MRNNFNPRSREGSDWKERYSGAGDRISIHAPARGATASLDGELTDQDDFNPRSREGSDVNLEPGGYVSSEFQSTLPRGERPITVELDNGDKVFQSTLPRGERHMQRSSGCTLNTYFNPRSREGSDTAQLVDRE